MLGFEPDDLAEPRWLRATLLLDRVYRALCAVRAELALALVGPERWRAVVAARYDRCLKAYASARYESQGLFDWERAAVLDHFPRPPARVLVGGAGAGREMLALAALGYGVAGFDPSPAMLDALRHRLGESGVAAPVALGGYEDLVTAFGFAPAPPEWHALLEAAPYDAVIVGGGSLSYIVEARVREQLLSTLARLCPVGPVLASFLEREPPVGRSLWLAAIVRRLLRLAPGARPPAPGDRLGEFGFEHAFDAGEIAALAAGAGYDVAHSASEPFPHALLVRASTG